MAKGLSANRVCTFLIDLKPSDLDGPLSQFNHTTPDKESMKSLLMTVNKELQENSLEDRILDQVFETYWPKFEESFGAVKAPSAVKGDLEPSRSNDEILEEILYTTRTMDKRIRAIESDRSSSYKQHRRIPKDELILMIDLMIENGADPNDIRRELRGMGPTSFIIEYATEAWGNRKQTSSNDDPENT